MKKMIFLVFILILGFTTVKAQVKTAVYWTAPTMSLNNARALAKFDLLIVDLENMTNNHQVLDSLKKWNPKILLIAYSNPVEMFSSMVSKRPLQKAWADTITRKYPSWLLKTNLGNQAVFYPGMSLLNISTNCPKIAGQNYGEFMDSLLIHEVLSDPIWDGYFMDNGGPNISWVYSGEEKIDANNDHQPDQNFLLDHSWSQGVYAFLKRIRRAKGPNFIIIANKGVPVFMDVLNGRMFENFPNNYLGDKTDQGWWQDIANAHQTGNFTIFQVKRENLNLAIASGLLMDHPVYIAVGQNNTEYYPQIKTGLKNGQNVLIQRQLGKGLIRIIPTKGQGEILIEK